MSKGVIQEGFNINYLGYLMGWTQTPLMMASSNGNINIVKMLLDNGADINIRGKWGKDEMTAIDWAIQSTKKSKKEIFDLLIDKNPEITDETIDSAKEVLESTKYTATIKKKYQYFYDKLIESKKIPTLRKMAFQLLSNNDKKLVKERSMLPLNGGKKRNRKRTCRKKKCMSRKRKYSRKKRIKSIK